jgi:G3E family GTPase
MALMTEATDALCRSAGGATASTAGIPVTIITGFLGAGKTTLINRLLEKSDGERLAVIVNEFGALGIDGALLSGRQGNVVELTNGCMCCESRGNLIAALAELADRGSSIDSVLVETSGLADPFGVADVLVQNAFVVDFILASVVTVVDADNFDANLDHAEAAYRQLVCADLLVVSKADLVPEAVVNQIRVRVRIINSHAGFVVADHGQPPPEIALHDVARNQAQALSFAGGVRRELDALAWRSLEYVDVERFTSWVEGLPREVRRLKAILVTAYGIRSVQRVGLRTSVSTAPHAALQMLGGDAVRMVLFAKDFDKRWLTNEFDCFREVGNEV